VIRLLAEIVSKGGSLLLGVGPQPDGTLSVAQVRRLKEIGDWLKVNGSAIYGTRTATIDTDGKNFFTKGKDGKIYVIIPFEEGKPVPAKITWKGNLPKKGKSVQLLMNGSSIKWTMRGDAAEVTLPRDVTRLPAYPAVAFSFYPAK
jgi:alpha-L-fucosidase